MLSWSGDLTRQNTVCHEKALLGAISEDKSQAGAFNLYYQYFKKYCLTHANANVKSTEARTKTEKLARKICTILTIPGHRLSLTAQTGG